MQNTKILFFSAALLLSSCSPQAVERKPASSGNKVHYEAVNANGELLSHITVDDESPAAEDDVYQKSSVPSTVVPLSNPDARNRVGMVFLGDGYTSAEIAQYDKDVASIYALLKNEEPFKSYLDYFSFFSVQVVSTTSGIGNEASSRLGMYYNCSGLDRLLCINSTRAMTEAKLAPRADLVFAMANSTKYGGAGYRTPAISTLAARNPAAVELAVHEMGHSFANLADEYEEAGTDSTCSSRPNAGIYTVSEMISKKTKWYRWLDVSSVGAFQGSCYSSKIYRPTSNSKMRTLGRPFEEINTEQLIIAMYKKLSPIEFSTPNSSTYKAHTLFQVVPMKPTAHALTIQWYLNDQLLPSLTGQTSVDTRNLTFKANTTQYLKAKVTDNTPAVRDEDARALYMSRTIQWKFKIK